MTVTMEKKKSAFLFRKKIYNKIKRYSSLFTLSWSNCMGLTQVSIVYKGYVIRRIYLFYFLAEIHFWSLYLGGIFNLVLVF
jgi:hypothetical protein